MEDEVNNNANGKKFSKSMIRTSKLLEKELV